MKKKKAYIALILMAASLSCVLCSCGSNSPMESSQIEPPESFYASDDQEQLEVEAQSGENTISDEEAAPSDETISLSEGEPFILRVEDAANFDDMAVTVQESERGLSMQVPESLCGDLICNLGKEILFSFYDQTTQDTTDYEGRIWYLFYLTAQEFAQYFEDRDEDVPTSWPETRIDANGFYIGKDDHVMYILVLPSDVQYAGSSAQSRESYYLHNLYGYHMLSDFFNRNGIEENPYWKQEYLLELQRLGLKTGDFFTTEYGLGSTVGADEQLLEKAAQIANLAIYDSDDVLTWNDLLLYKLINSDYSSMAEASEIDDVRSSISKMMIRFSESMMDYLHTDRLDEKICAILSKLFLELRDDPSLPDLCLQEQWILTAEDNGYTLQVKNENGEIVFLQSIEI